jgi:sirohydrochlorin ferrochelatase
MTTKPGLLIIAHGSRRPAANEEIRRLTERIEVVSQPDFIAVRHAFLEFADPSVAEQIDTLAATGSRHLVLFPFFLSAGSHVSVDIPTAVAAAREKHPLITFQVVSHLGGCEGIVPLILSEITVDRRRIVKPF